MAENLRGGGQDPSKKEKGEDNSNPSDRLVGATASGDGTDGLNVNVRVTVDDHVGQSGDISDDARDRVAVQTGAIFSQFMWECYSNDLETRHLPENTPALPELNESKPRPFSTEERIGIELASIGDEIADKYSDKISKMIDCLKVDNDNAYETFSRVASSLFQDNEINWGRVVALFLFGYRIAIEKVRSGVHSFIKKIIQWIVEFVKVRIVDWILKQGGWTAFFTTPLIAGLNNTGLALICMAAGFFTLAAYFITRRN